MKRFFEAIATAYDTQPGLMTAELSGALRSSEHRGPTTPYEPSLTGRMLDQILATQGPDPHPLLDEVARVRESLVWYRAEPERIPDAIGSRLSFVELLGPDGMVHCDHCRLGLFLQMPDFCYPGHAHSA